MTKRDFLQISDLSLAEARQVLDMAREMKRARRESAGAFRGRSAAIVMEKASTRTRVSFEVGASELGMHPVVVTAQGSQLARGEPVGDTARVLSGYVDLIVFRTSSRERLVEMATWASVPVINALSDDGHPVQVLSDIFTIEEALGPIEGKVVAWIGDGGSNMARSFVEAAALFRFDLRVGGPAAYFPADRGSASFTTDVREAVRGAHVLCTDVWTSMGQEADNERRLRDFAGWTVNREMVKGAHREAIVLHCLPAHRGEEISGDVIEGPESRVWVQAENRLHVQKALMTFLLRSSGP
jgi:ornithine carbamoyltransferase